MNAKENEIKDLFNKLIVIDFHKKIIISDHFVFSNKEYESISDFFSEFNLKYDKEIINIKSKIINLSELNKLFDFKKFKVCYLAIKRNLVSLNKDINMIDSLLKDLLNYNNYISFLVVGYRDNSSKLISFCEKNLLLTFHLKELDNLIERIKNSNLKLNEFFLPINVDSIFDDFNEINKYLVAFVNLLDKLYVYDKLHKYIIYSIAEINDFLKNNVTKIDTSNVNYANKSLTKLNSNFLTLNKKLTNYEFDKVEIISKYLVFELLNIKRKLQLNFKASEFFSENKNTLIEIINLIKDKYPDLKKNLLKIENNFSNDSPFLELIRKNINDLNDLFCYIEKLNLDNQQNLTSDQILQISKKIIFEVISWSKSCETIVKNVKSKYNYFKEIVKEITSNKLIISQMLAFMYLNKIYDEKRKKNILSLKENLETTEKNLFIDFNNNFDYHYNLLLDITEEINLIKEDLIKMYYAKIYIEKIIWEINLKIFQKNKFNLSIEEIMKNYKKGNYLKSANEAIKFLKHYFK